MSIQVPSPAYDWTSGASTRPEAGNAPTSASADRTAATPRRDGTRAMSRRYRVRWPVAHNRPMAAEEELPAWSLPDDAVAVSLEGDEVHIEPDGEGDLCGHGTACAGIVRSFAPECELHSVRVLGAGYTGSGAVLLAGLRWAVEQGFDVVNMSLSTTKQKFASMLHELADEAYFRRTMLIASAHNMPVASYPWRFASVLSVGSHELEDSYAFFYNPTP